MNDLDWDDNEFPLAYLITFRTFGTWLHGDERKAVDRHGRNFFGTERVLPSQNLERIMTENRSDDEFLLNGKQRSAVEASILSICSFRGYCLNAINVRSNHVHTVVRAACAPELVMNAFKANCTRELRMARLVGPGEKIWSRGGSTRYLWKPYHVERAVEYVLYGQGIDLSNF